MNINDVLKQSPVMSGPFPKFDDSTYNDPITHFKAWFKSAVESEVTEPRSMVLSTYDKTHTIDSRVIVIKAMDEEGFFIESGRGRTKVDQLNDNNHVAINFYWREQGRQIRFQGVALQNENIDHVIDYLDAKSRDLAVYKLTPVKAEFYQALETGGYERLLYELKEDEWQVRRV